MTRTDVWAGSASLDELRALPTIVYRTYTVLGPVGGVDGSLQSVDGTVDYPLDLWTPKEFQPSKRQPKSTFVRAAQKAWHSGLVASIHQDHGVLMPDEQMSHDRMVDAVTRWAREHLGRTDIAFEDEEGTL